MLRSVLLASVSGLLATLSAGGAIAAEDQVDDVVVLGKRVIRNSASATGLDLSLRETPQSVTVVTQEQLETFGLTEVNQLLSTMPGINVDAAETDRTYYNARGFDIVNFQVDGVGQPLDWGLQTGALDLAIYDRIEAVRGANGLMTGTGNPSATLNYIRKRPTKDFQGALSGAYGSWDTVRLTGDVSGPIAADGAVTGRLVYANTDGGSYLDYYKVNRNVYYGALAWDVTPSLNATVGYSRQDNRATGNTWGALPLLWSDGTPIDYDVSATTSAPWTHWDTLNESAFGELSYAFANGWTIKGVYTHKRVEEDAKLLYAYGNPDRTTGLGVGGYSGVYPSKLTQDLFDVIANGAVTVFGREHELVFGVNHALNDSSKSEAVLLFDYPAYRGATITPPAEPVYSALAVQETIDDRLTRAYAAAHLNLSDRLKVVAGANLIDLKTEGVSYGVSQARSETKVSPYVGAVYDVNGAVSLYASYSDIFSPQHENDINMNRLDAAKGVSYEAGIKSEWFAKRLYATAAVFRSKQDNLAEFAGRTATGKSYYNGIDTVVTGYEFEVAGRITPAWTLNGGWTDLEVENGQGEKVRTYVPRRTLKLATTYDLPRYNDLRLGAAVRWQSDVTTKDIGVTVRQPDFAVVDLTAGVRVTQRVRATLNVKNVFDETYFSSLRWSQAFYAPPRNILFTLDYSF